MNSQEERSIQIYQLFLLFGLGILVLATARLQLIPNDFRTKAESVTLDKEVIPASRGHIYDRRGNLLAGNVPQYSIQLTYSQLSPRMDTSFLCQLLSLERDEFEKMIQKDWSDYRYSKNVPFVFMERIVDSVALTFQEYQFMFPGFRCVLKTAREYKTDHAAHVLGYLKSVDREYIENEPDYYGLTDYVGAIGIESSFERQLRGKKGVRYILKDKYGRELESYLYGTLDSAAQSGNDLILGLDEELQAYAEALLQGRKGAVVAIEPSTGEILAMVSAPTYDPSMMEMTDRRSFCFDSLSRDSMRPLFNRATMARYPPGSIIKPIFSLIALEQGLITPQERVYCDGVYRYRTFTYGCHKHKRNVNLAEALAVSCNSYYFDNYRRMVEVNGFDNPKPGLDALMDQLHLFGLGQNLVPDFGAQNSGFMPDGSYYDRLYGVHRWRSTYTISLGIGQGELELTTVQMANLAAILANKGTYYPPHLLKAYRAQDGEVTPVEYTKKEVSVKKQHFETLEQGLLATVEIGTGINAKIPNLNVCGKTGTSQNPHGEDHSVFFAYAPMENPQIALAVYIENGGAGGFQAAPMAGLLIEKYLRGEISSSRKYWENLFLPTPNS